MMHSEMISDDEWVLKRIASGRAAWQQLIDMRGIATLSWKKNNFVRKDEADRVLQSSPVQWCVGGELISVFGTELLFDSDDD